MKKYKIILCDYDGTLIGSNNKISDENLQAINSFISRGGIFVVCSGRATDAISKPLKEQNFKGLVASFNGAKLSDILTGETLYSHAISNKDCIKFFSYVKENGLYAHFYPETQYLYPYKTKYTEHYEKVTGVKGILCEDMISYLKETQSSSLKLLVFDDKEKLDKHYLPLKNLMSNLEVVRSTDNMIDFNLKGIDKGSALDKISAYFGLDRSLAVAIGDAGNDYSMIKVAGLGVAVSNATEEIKKIADYIAPSNDENAIKHVIEKFCI